MLNLLKKESLYSNVRVGYIITLIIYSLARQNITALQPYLMSDILNLLVIGVAGLIVCWDVFIFKNIWKTKYIWILAAFAGFTVISSAVGFRYGYIENIKTLANLFIQFCLLFVVGLKKERQDLEKEIRIISTVVSAIWLIAVVISLYMYFADITYEQNRYLWGETTVIPQGFVHKQKTTYVMRLWGVFVDPNFASATSIALIAMSMFSIFTTKKKGLKGFHIANIVLQFLYIILSNSRMGLLSLCLSALVLCWYYAIFLFKSKKMHIVIKEVLAVFLAVACAGVCYGSAMLTKTVLPYIQYGIAYTADFVEEMSGEKTTVAEESATKAEKTTSEKNSEEKTTEKKSDEEKTTKKKSDEEKTTKKKTSEEKTTKKKSNKKKSNKKKTSSEKTTAAETTTGLQVNKLERGDVLKKSDVSNGRFKLWLQGLENVFANHPVFGVGPRNYHTVANEINPKLKISTGYSIHNSYIELLMGNGVIGTLVLILFFALCAKDIIVVRYKDPRKAKGVGFLSAGIVNFIICGMFIACLFYTLSGATVLLFTFLGYAVRLSVLEDSNQNH